MRLAVPPVPRTAVLTLLAIVFALAFALGPPAPAAADFEAVEVRLSPGVNRFQERMVGETYPFDAHVIIHCAFRDIRTRLHVYQLSREELGRTFDTTTIADLNRLEDEGERIASSRRATLSCGDLNTFTYDLRAPDEPGTYFVGACLPTLRDEDGEVFNTAGGEANFFNCSDVVQVTVTRRPAADLVVSAARIRPVREEVEPETPLTVEVTVRNVGDGASGPTMLDFLRSPLPDDLRRSGAVVAQRRLAPLAPGESRVERIETTAPTAVRTSYFGACVSRSPWGEDDGLPGGWTDVESETGNNCSAADAAPVRTSASRLPDVAVTETAFDVPSARTGEPVNLTFALDNRQGADFKGGWVVLRKALRHDPVVHRLPAGAAARLADRLRDLDLGERFSRGGAPPGPELRLEGLLLPLREVEQDGILVPGRESAPVTTPVTAPDAPGLYEFQVCATYVRDRVGCGPAARLLVLAP